GPLRGAGPEELDGSVLVTFEGISDRTAAEPLAGAYVTVPLADARTLPADRYYHFQLVGLTVFDTRRARRLGRVAEVLTYPANDVLQVTEGDDEVWLPMIRGVGRPLPA